MITHFIEADQPTFCHGRQVRASCGRVVHPDTLSPAPTCPDCKALLDEDEQTLRAIQSDPDYGKAAR